MDWLIGARHWLNFAGWVEQQIGINPLILGYLLNTLIIIIAYFLLRRALRQLVLRRVEDSTRRYRINKGIAYALGVLAVLAILKVWLLGRLDMTTYLGFVSAGLAIALRDPIVNIVGWMYILWRKPFQSGDRIEIGAHAGDVVDIGISTFTLLEIGHWVHADQSTGRIIHVPNATLFTQPCCNFTQGFSFIWNEVEVVVTFDSDWEHAHALMTEIARDITPDELVKQAEQQIKQTSQKYEVVYRRLTPIVWVDVVPHGVRLTLRHLCPVRTRRSNNDLIWRRILEAFADNPSVSFAHPIQRVQLTREGVIESHGVG